MRELEFELSGGIVLAAHAYGNPGDPAVILSHGGGQTRHSWGSTAELLAQAGWYAVAYDHRGHGGSSWSEDGDYHIDRFAEDQLELAKQLPGRPVLVGASLGGLAAIIAEGEHHEDVFSAIILVDIVPRMNIAGAEKIIGFMGTHMEEGFASLDEAADVIAEYTGRPRRKDLGGLSKNLRLDDDGRYRWHWDPSFILQRSSRDKLANPDRLSAAASSIALPLLLVRGQLSDIVTPEVARGFLRDHPDADYVDVKDASHMIAGDRNDVFSQAILNFLAKRGCRAAAQPA
ncbi:MAG: alpha/beta hydrolase [Pseudomonadota bacterium]